MTASFKILPLLAFALFAGGVSVRAADLNHDTNVEAASISPDMIGDWGGTLVGTLRLILHVKKSSSGGYAAVLESVDQGNAMIPVDSMNVTAARLNFTVNAVHGSFDATWNAETKAWVGTWKQDQAMPLTLVRSNGVIPKLRRPQEDAIDAAPSAYEQQTVTFDGGSAGVKLAGTFSTPKGAGPFPTIIFIAGSGPHTREEVVAGHRIFYVLADYLNKRGIAVLRYDKRGVGQSSGDYKSATSAEFISDAAASVRYLMSRADVDQKHIGLLGHSEGGLIAPAVAAHDPQVSFIILLAGPAISGDKLLAEQIYLIEKASGVPAERAVMGREVNEELFKAIAESKSESEAKSKAAMIFDKAIEEHKIFGNAEQIKAAGLSGLTTPWMRYFLSYDPVPALRQLKVPVLALNGSLDLQVPAKSNLAAMRLALSENKEVMIKELAHLNHLFQSANTGAPAEYAQIEETINPGVLNVIGEWVSDHAKSK
ncbi:alpha/beta hydrolase family protein [Undibacterium sp. Ji67W]|uniref:alpha/beta hydrolase family protein n=1 Tax=Undibacterium sp. Ji67W TaxID=3413042 RepID=UPI003BF42FF7